MRRFILVWSSLVVLIGMQWVQAAGKAEHIVVVVWDGMRPDFVTEEWTPNLYKLARSGVSFKNHHAVYLSATEVNGTALATGAYPAQSGIIANLEYRPNISALKAVGTEAKDTVRRGDQLTQGQYLLRSTVAEILQSHAWRTAIAGSKPVALLHDRKERAHHDGCGFNLFAGQTLPAQTWPVLTNLFGPFPETPKTKSNLPNAPRDLWTTQSLLGPLWDGGVPKFSVLWLSEPDFSQHEHGPGSPTALAALRSSDDNLGRLCRELEKRNALDKTDVLVVSDHGFSTITRNVDVAAALRQAGFQAAREFKRKPVAGEIVVAGNGGSVLLYVVGHDAELTRGVVAYLQSTDFVGVIFTKEPMKGTFTLDQARINSPEAPEIVFSFRWSAEKSATGTPGLVMAEGTRGPGQGMHVSLSPFDLHNTFIAAGPDFRAGMADTLPTGNTDIAPTILWIFGMTPPQPMDGRVVTEALTMDGPAVRRFAPIQYAASQEHGQFVWRQHLNLSRVNDTVYLEEGNGGAELK